MEPDQWESRNEADCLKFTVRQTVFVYVCLRAGSTIISSGTRANIPGWKTSASPQTRSGHQMFCSITGKTCIMSEHTHTSHTSPSSLWHHSLSCPSLVQMTTLTPPLRPTFWWTPVVSLSICLQVCLLFLPDALKGISCYVLCMSAWSLWVDINILFV